MSDRQNLSKLSWFSAFYHAMNAVVGVQWQTEVGSLLPGMQAGGNVQQFPCTPAACLCYSHSHF